jgi:hypothetical protein
VTELSDRDTIVHKIHKIEQKSWKALEGKQVVDFMMTAPPKTPMRSLSDRPAGDRVISRRDVDEAAQDNNDLHVPEHASSPDIDNANPVSPFEKRKCPSYYSLPKCVFPPRKDMNPVEKFVAGTLDFEIGLSPEKEAKRRQAYERMNQTFRENSDPEMVHKLLLALRTAGNGSTLHQLSGNPGKHVELLRLLHQFNPFQPNPPKGTSDKNPEEPPKQIDNALYLNFSMADAHFHLLLALVSANSVFLVPSMVRAHKHTHLQQIPPTSMPENSPNTNVLTLLSTFASNRQTFGT